MIKIRLLKQIQWQNYLKMVSFFVLFWLVGSYINLPVRNFLKEQFNDIPYWMDHILFMILAKTLVAGIIAYFFLNKEEVSLKSPIYKKYWVEGVLGGVGFVLLIGITLKALGVLQFQMKPEPLIMLGNTFSNFYEEFIYRGVLLGIFMKFSNDKKWLAIFLSSIAFLNGHLYYPLPFLILIFLSGAYWAGLTIRSNSIFPAWVSHCLVDFVADSIFVI